MSRRDSLWTVVDKLPDNVEDWNVIEEVAISIDMPGAVAKLRQEVIKDGVPETAQLRVLVAKGWVNLDSARELPSEGDIHVKAVTGQGRTDTILQQVRSSYLKDQRDLPGLAVSTSQQPAELLAVIVGYAVGDSLSGQGEHMVVIDSYNLVISLMRHVQKVFGIRDSRSYKVDPYGASEGLKRPDALLFLSDILMFKFFAVTRGGGNRKAVSKKFDTSSQIDRLKILHTAIRVLTIVLQQTRHQLPANPLPLNTTMGYRHSTITYWADHVVKLVNWAAFENADGPTLTKVYQVLLQLPNDVLHGLVTLHFNNIVHRDVRAPNILEMPGDAHTQIDYEHSGFAEAVPPFHPLSRWPRRVQGVWQAVHQGG
ncbi:hypothetical protein WJX72_006724 [[Myrmecia] bisecta]|uniref:Protein kinase domain-containing protein n=1 Tax=[Myrmecia] bisecta TaxID=41462 RepID=A0AAW1P3S1_9CHLO